MIQRSYFECFSAGFQKISEIDAFLSGFDYYAPVLEYWKSVHITDACIVTIYDDHKLQIRDEAPLLEGWKFEVF